MKNANNFLDFGLPNVIEERLDLKKLPEFLWYLTDTVPVVYTKTSLIQSLSQVMYYWFSFDTALRNA